MRLEVTQARVAMPDQENWNWSLPDDVTVTLWAWEDGKVIEPRLFEMHGYSSGLMRANIDGQPATLEEFDAALAKNCPDWTREAIVKSARGRTK